MAEKDSIAFYLGMKDFVLGTSEKIKIKDVIQEEIRHVHLLGDKLAALKK